MTKLDEKLTLLPSLSPLEKSDLESATNEKREKDKDGRFICGELNIKIDKEGRWYYNNSPIGRKALVKLFSSVIEKDKNDTYWLVTPAEKGQIFVEDVPFMAVECEVDGTGEKQVLTFRTNVDDHFKAGAKNPLIFRVDSNTNEPKPYILVRKNLEAKLTRPVFYQVVDLGVEELIKGERMFGVWSKTKFFVIGKV